MLSVSSEALDTKLLLLIPWSSLLCISSLRGNCTSGEAEVTSYCAFHCLMQKVHSRGSICKDCVLASCLFIYLIFESILPFNIFPERICGILKRSPSNVKSRRACVSVHAYERACVRACVCTLTPRLSDPAVVDQVPHQSLRAALGRCDTKAGSHKTFSIIQSPSPVLS